MAVLVSLSVTVLCALYGFGGMFDRAYIIFAHAQEEDMSFGWFVPVPRGITNEKAIEEG